MVRSAPHGPLIVVRRDEDELKRYIQKNRPKTAERLAKLGLDPAAFVRTELGFLLCLGSFKGETLGLDAFQIRFLRANARFRSLLKSRQVGYSWIMAAEMLARCHIRSRHVAVCISYNLDDAKEKIALVKELHDELPLAYQKKLVTDTKTEVAFESNNSKRRLSRIHSMPSKAPRGKSGDVYLDEFAHCLNDRIIYQGATAVTIRSGGQFTVGSTPWGRRGMFYRIHTRAEDVDNFELFWRQDIPWWLAKNFCRDVRLAAFEAPGLETEERVVRFGTRELIDQFSSLPIDDFKQEYELEFQDERVAFFPIDLVLTCCRKDRGDRDSSTDLFIHDTVESLSVDEGGPLFAGFDVGRTKHPSELYVVEQRGDGYALRYQESYRNLQFEDQKQRLSRLVDVLGPRLRALRIDAGGLGMNLAEDLRRKHGPKVEEWQFTAPIKVELANNLKILFENRALDLPKDRDLIRQLGAVRQKITESGMAVFDVAKEKNAKHHADKVWALALAVWRKGRKKTAVHDVGVRILGERPVEPLPAGVRAAPYAPPVDDRDLNSIFDVPDEKFVPRRPEFAPDPPSPLEASVLAGTATSEELSAAPLASVERRRRVLLVSLESWRRDRDLASSANATVELEALDAELAHRRSPPLEADRSRT